MTLEEIKAAVDSGLTVHWASDIYDVVHDNTHPPCDQWLIICRPNNHCIGLTWRDGVTMNGDESQFYIHGTREEHGRHESQDLGGRDTRPGSGHSQDVAGTDVQ